MMLLIPIHNSPASIDSQILIEEVPIPQLVTMSTTPSTLDDFVTYPYRISLLILWSILTPLHLYTTTLLLYSCRSQRRTITITERHERLRDRQYLLPRVIIGSVFLNTLTLIVHISIVQAFWSWLRTMISEMGVTAVQMLLGVLWLSGLFYALIMHFSESSYLEILHKAFFCRKCAPGYKRFVPFRNGAYRRLTAKGPGESEASLCNSSLSRSFGGDFDNGFLEPLKAAGLVDAGVDSCWLYGFCDSHWDDAFGDDDEESQMRALHEARKQLRISLALEDRRARRNDGWRSSCESVDETGQRVVSLEEQ